MATMCGSGIGESSATFGGREAGYGELCRCGRAGGSEIGCVQCAVVSEVVPMCSSNKGHGDIARERWYGDNVW
eukprot:1882956-Rhodomonas_salina.1